MKAKTVTMYETDNGTRLLSESKATPGDGRRVYVEPTTVDEELARELRDALTAWLDADAS